MLAQVDCSLAAIKGAAARSARAFADSGDLAMVPKIIKELRSEERFEVANSLEKAPPFGVCWMVESFLGEDLGTVCKRLVPQKYQPRPSIHIDLTLPLEDPERPLPDAAGNFIGTTLDHILRDLNMGEASMSGAASRAGSHRYFQESLSIDIQGDSERGFHLVREVLWWSGAPETIPAWIRKQKISLALDQNDRREGDAFLQLARIRTAHWEVGDTKGYRLDRVAIPESCWSELQAVLAKVEAIGPDENGWSTVALPDGARWEFVSAAMARNPGLTEPPFICASGRPR